MEVGSIVSDAPRRNRFPRRMRLSRNRDFRSVFEARTRASVDPLLVYARPNARSHPRLGLSVSRRVGNAVLRNRIKRLIREAFRQIQHDLPGAYDYVVAVRPHDPLRLQEYAARLRQAIDSVHLRWIARNINPSSASNPAQESDSPPKP